VTLETNTCLSNLCAAEAARRLLHGVGTLDQIPARVSFGFRPCLPAASLCSIIWFEALDTGPAIV
jgi:hypothetical protein